MSGNMNSVVIIMLMMVQLIFLGSAGLIVNAVKPGFSSENATTLDYTCCCSTCGSDSSTCLSDNCCGCSTGYCYSCAYTYTCPYTLGGTCIAPADDSYYGDDTATTCDGGCLAGAIIGSIIGWVIFIYFIRWCCRRGSTTIITQQPQVVYMPNPTPIVPTPQVQQQQPQTNYSPQQLQTNQYSPQQSPYQNQSPPQYQPQQQYPTQSSPPQIVYVPSPSGSMSGNIPSPTHVSSPSFTNNAPPVELINEKGEKMLFINGQLLRVSNST